MYDEEKTTKKIDNVLYYPAISYEEACKKVEKSISNISKDSGESVDKVFDEILI